MSKFITHAAAADTMQDQVVFANPALSGDGVFVAGMVGKDSYEASRERAGRIQDQVAASHQIPARQNQGPPIVSSPC